MAPATGEISHNRSAQSMWKPNWFTVGAMALTAGTIAGFYQAFILITPPITTVDTRKEPAANPQIEVTCSGLTIYEQAACETLMDHLQNRSSNLMIAAFGALSATRGITRENRMELPRNYASVSYNERCQVPIMGPHDLDKAVMWGVDFSLESCPFLATRYEETDPHTNQTKECALTLSQASIKRGWPLYSVVAPVTCEEPDSLNPAKTPPDKFQKTLQQLFKGAHVTGRTLDGRTVVLRLQK